MLFALVLAFALPATLGFALLIQHFYVRERVQVERDTLFVVRSMMQAVDRDLDLGIVAARALAMSAELDQGDLAGFHRKATSIVNAGFSGSNIVLSTRDSVQLLNTLRPYGAPIPDPGSRERIQRVFETGQVVVSDVFIGGVTAIVWALRSAMRAVTSLTTGCTLMTLPTQALARQRLRSDFTGP